MARFQSSIDIEKQSWQEADRILAKIEAAVRGEAISGAIRKVGNLVKTGTRAILPKPGYPGDKPGMKPLRDTLKVKVKSYQGGSFKIGVVGYTYTKEPGMGGNHGHLVERGHDMVVGGPKGKGGRVVGFVQPYEYMIKIVKSTKTEQNRTLVEGVKIALEKAKK